MKSELSEHEGIRILPNSQGDLVLSCHSNGWRVRQKERTFNVSDWFEGDGPTIEMSIEQISFGYLDDQTIVFSFNERAVLLDSRTLSVKETLGYFVVCSSYHGTVPISLFRAPTDVFTTLVFCDTREQIPRLFNPLFELGGQVYSASFDKGFQYLALVADTTTGIGVYIYGLPNLSLQYLAGLEMDNTRHTGIEFSGSGNTYLVLKDNEIFERLVSNGKTIAKISDDSWNIISFTVLKNEGQVVAIDKSGVLRLFSRRDAPPRGPHDLRWEKRFNLFLEAGELLPASSSFRHHYIHPGTHFFPSNITY